MNSEQKSSNQEYASAPESAVLEYKENTSSKSYLKTVSAFANYRDGEIIFGIADDRRITGLADPEKEALNLENQVNDNVHPQPKYQIRIDQTQRLVILTVYRGKITPYRYKGKAFRRNGTSTIEVDDYELNQLILQGKNLEFCDLQASSQNLTFGAFSEYWNACYSLPVSQDLMATLGSYEQVEGYTITAELISDQNRFPGISVVQFGESVSQIENRKLFENCSLLKMNEQAMEMVIDLLSYEEVSGLYREMKTRVPAVALRETLINAIVHRDWSIHQPVQIEIFPDKMTILSPGGLPGSMSEEEYLNSGRSIPRNTQLTIIFLRLNLIEKLGTGLRRVREAYKGAVVQPIFTVFPNSVKVELPFINRKPQLDQDQRLIIEIIKEKAPVKRKQIEQTAGFSQSKTTRILKDLLSKGLIEKTNSGPKTEYRANM